MNGKQIIITMGPIVGPTAPYKHPNGDICKAHRDRTAGVATTLTFAKLATYLGFMTGEKS